MIRGGLAGSCAGLARLWPLHRPAGRVSPLRARHFYRNPQSGFSLFAKGALRARGLLTSRSEVTQTPKVPKRKATLAPASLRFAAGNLRCSVQPGSKTTRFAQTSFCPDPSGPPLLVASTRGNRERGQKTKNQDKYKQGLAMASPCGFLYSGFCLRLFGISSPASTPCGCAEERRARRIRAKTCLSEASCF